MSKALAKPKPFTHWGLIRALKRIVGPFDVAATLDIDIIDSANMRITFKGERTDGVKLFVQAVTGRVHMYSEHEAILTHFRNAVDEAAKQ